MAFGVAFFFVLALALVSSVHVRHRFLPLQQVSGIPMIRGKIMMGFKTADNLPVVVVRNFQVSQKKTKREFKQTDGVIKSKNQEGEPIQMSHRCTDMEKLVPQLLGIFSTVLACTNKFVFC